ncbi:MULTISPECIES: DUF4365 domain-containing protein [Flavobacterium]|uniref:DUF4365 domain-containing protein n=1 Tax=Flavobacterium TaxID=237 RepID=UPI002115B8DA|nr:MULTISPECIES: DUF4365 domain-containing protein [Flavobacterium]UUF15714.1 DUF4365 domain-containing protein [Flavobacterium panici]
MKRNDEIQIEADSKLELKLMKLFRESGLEYKQHESDQKKEKGIDFYCHVYHRENQTQLFFFETQNKGTNTPIKVIKSESHPEKGKISFQLELRHAKQYYYELTEPLLFMYSDITSDTTYWYAIQLDASIEDKISLKESELKESELKKSNTKKPTIQIYIPSENLLNSENFSRFTKEIHFSRLQQNHKGILPLQTKADYKFIKDKIKDKDIIDKAIFSIDLFEGMNVIPTNIISQLYPFKETSTKTYIFETDLKTDNEDFFDLMDSITLDGAKLISNRYNNDELVSEKLEKIIRFFTVNCIDHVHWAGSSEKPNRRVCIHKLFKGKPCDCERCNYDKLNFIKAQTLLQNDSDQYTLHEKLRRAYTSYSMGNFNESIKLLKLVDKEATKNKKIIFSTIARYNLIQLRKIISTTYFHKDRTSLLEILKNINLEIKEADIQLNAPHFYDLYKWIKDDSFFDRAFANIDNKLEEIKRISFNDKYGVQHSNNHSYNLLVSFLRLYYFLEFNLIIYNTFDEYKQLTTKVLEASLALYSLKNPNTSKYKKFTSTILDMWMFNINYDKGIHLLTKYNIKKINVENKEKTFSSLNSYLENLNNSITIVNNEENETLQDTSEIVIANLGLIISRIKFSEPQINELVSKLLLILANFNLRTIIPFGALYQLLLGHKKINNNNIKKLIFLLREHNGEYSSVFSYAIKYYSENSSPNEIEKLVYEIVETEVINEEIIFSKDNKLDSIGYAISFLNSDLKKSIKNIIINRLKENFDPEFYSVCAIHNLIDFEKDLLDKFAKTVPDVTKRDPERYFINSNQNFRLGKLINLMYKYNQPFSDEIKLLSNFTFQKDYYDWLMDLDGFDYSKFNQYWILEYQTKFYFKAFKKSKILKKQIKKALKKDYIEGVAKIYFNSLV